MTHPLNEYFYKDIKELILDYASNQLYLKGVMCRELYHLYDEATRSYGCYTRPTFRPKIFFDLNTRYSIMQMFVSYVNWRKLRKNKEYPFRSFISYINQVYTPVPSWYS
jgi:hypothetical protein